uniref:Hypothetical chloroplast RF1 n=1 Tax=Neglectella solitaria TaxID=120749 RepID=C7BEJ5_NEGSO|nr:hypothetical chloroplast RF1 [Neglectella solitaria]
MYFIPLIRDYIEFINNIYESLSGDTNFQTIIQQSLIFLAQNIKFIFVYFISFQWFRDFFYLPVLIPQYSDSILRENFFLETPLLNIFNFLETPYFTQNKIFIGFLNGLFLSLPFSCSQLIYIRRLVIQGNIAGICAGLGNIFGQILFISSVLFGLRFLVIPWFSFEPFNYFIGVFVLLNIVYDLIHERTIRILDWKNKNELLKIFFLNFVLIWTEQSCIFQYLGNLTFEAQPTSLDILSSNSDSTFFISHFNYIFGLFFGCLFFTSIFAFLLQKLSQFIETKLLLLKSNWLIRLNFFFLTCILAFTFTSIPFYGLDFLITAPLGFVSEDKGLKKTFFSQNRVTDPFNLIGDKLSIFLDLKQFDRSIYLKRPILESFEELNYPADYASLIRQGNINLFSQYKEKARKIREIIIKKKESQTENSKTSNLANKKTLKRNDINKDIFFEYPTYFLDSKDNFIPSNIQTRFELSYKESPAFVFEVFLKYSLNKVFWKENYSLVYPELDKKIKQKFYTNPIFKFLLNIDIDNLIKRQPCFFGLSQNQEKLLYKKRLMLSRYYDTLRLYKNIPYVNQFEYFFNGSKSFADRVYNQQFKGTLRVVRRLFSVKTPQQSNILFTLKYDQLLYKRNNELQQNTEKNKNSLNFYHEELNTDFNHQKVFLESVNQTPLYIGWDEELKKIILTNRYLSRSKTSFIKPLPNENKTILFTTWPILDENLTEKELDLNNLQYSLLFKNKKTIQNLNYTSVVPLFEHEYKRSGISSYKSLPSNILKIASSMRELTPPNRGGFVWPGNSNLKISFDNLQKN